VNPKAEARRMSESARARGMPDRQEIDLTTPLRLAVAAALAYPDGSMTAGGLRREAKRGRLAIERTAGKDYTTLAAIEEMRQLCRVVPKDPVCGSVPPGGTRAGKSPTQSAISFSMEAANSALEALN
jgi:hypothetical protein